MSALANLAGMYPPKSGNLWQEGLAWQPIPVHSIPRMDDPVVWPERPCPTANDIFREVMKSDTAKRVEAENDEFLNFLRNVTGLKLETLYDMRLVWDPLNVEVRPSGRLYGPHLSCNLRFQRLHNLTHMWPGWVTEEIFDKIQSLFFTSTTFYFHDSRLQRLKGGEG